MMDNLRDDFFNNNITENKWLKELDILTDGYEARKKGCFIEYNK